MKRILLAGACLIGMYGAASAQDIDYNSPEGLCAAFVGRIAGERRGVTFPITCEMVHSVVDSQTITVPFFRRFTVHLRQDANRTFDEIIKDDKPLHDSCYHELFQKAYSCGIADGLSLRFVLNSDGTISRVEIAISVSNPELRAGFSRSASQTGVDRFSDDGIALVLHAMAMRCRQLSDNDELYRTDGKAIHVTIISGMPR